MIDLGKLEIKPLPQAENLNAERMIALLLNNLQTYAVYIAAQEKLIGMFYSREAQPAEVTKAAEAVIETRNKVLPVVEQATVEFKTYQELMNAKDNLAS